MYILSRSFKDVLGSHPHSLFLPEVANRLGSPGRIHHCMRSIGAASRALDLMIQRVTDPSRKTFGKLLHEHGTYVRYPAEVPELR